MPTRAPLEDIKTLHSAAAATANGEAFDAIGYDSVVVQVTGSSPVGTITFEGSVDGTTFVSLLAMNLATGAVATTTTVVGDFAIPLAGIRVFRARLTFTSGTWTVKAQGVFAAPATSLATQPTSSTVTSIVPGTAATNLGKAEDAAHTSGDTGVMSLAVRADTAAATGADGDYVPLLTDSTGKLHVNVGAVTPGTAASNLGKAEDAAHTTGDVGVMALAVRQDTAAATGADGDYVPITTDNLGQTRTARPVAGTATVTAVNDQATSTTLLAAAAGRKGVIAHNNSSADLYLKYGATATTSAGGYSYKIPAGEHWEMPEPIYVGIIDGIWSADSSGAVSLTELT